MRIYIAGSVFLSTFALTSGAMALPVLLTFEGMQDREGIGHFYNGGFADLGSGPGPSFGITFSLGAQAVTDFDDGGTGNFANEPSPGSILSFTSANSAVMNVAVGFETAVSAYYSSISAFGGISVYSGVDGTGTLLASIALNPLGSDPFGGDPNGAFNRWQQVNLNFQGLARSVVFTGTTNQIAFDNIAFENIVPAPGAAALLGLAGLGLRRRRRA